MPQKGSFEKNSSLTILQCKLVLPCSFKVDAANMDTSNQWIQALEA
jgi:hypothetical protein